MIGVGDPVRGLVASLARPGGNITGNTVLSPDLGPKRLQILREVIANVKRVVYLANPDNASNVAALAETNIAASAQEHRSRNLPTRRRTPRQCGDLVPPTDSPHWAKCTCNRPTPLVTGPEREGAGRFSLSAKCCFRVTPSRARA